MKRDGYMGKPPDSPVQDARANERSREKLMVSYTISPELPPEYTETYDIAVGGLAMLTNAALAPNLEIFIDLELRDDTRPKLRLTANVRWSTYDVLLEKYRTGVSFTNHSPEFELELLRYIDTLAFLRDLGAG
jgi:c-di-GMP-binding flagellar brake protein YcgR